MTIIKSTITINSNDCKGLSGDFLFQNNLRLEHHSFFRIKRVRVPLTYYNINTDNNRLVINLGASNINVDISVGVYDTFTDFINELESKLQNEDATFSVSYSYLTNKITISRTGNFSLILSDSTINHNIGFDNTDLSGSNTYTGSKSGLLDRNSSITLHSNVLTDKTNNQRSDNRSNILLTIPINDNLGSVINYETNVDEFYKFHNHKILNNVSFTFRDSFNNIIDFQGIPTEIEIHLYD